MFTTIENVKAVTGYDVTQETIIQAQTIIESYVGRVEIEVSNPVDQELLGRAVAYQCAYMNDDPVRIFEQVAAQQLSQFGSYLMFRANDIASPFVAPLAILACQRLSWKRIRSVRTGSLFPTPPVETGWSRD